MLFANNVYCNMQHFFLHNMCTVIIFTRERVNAPKATIYHDLNFDARYLEWKSGESADEIVFIALLN